MVDLGFQTKNLSIFELFEHAIIKSHELQKMLNNNEEKNFFIVETLHKSFLTKILTYPSYFKTLVIPYYGRDLALLGGVEIRDTSVFEYFYVPSFAKAIIASEMRFIRLNNLNLIKMLKEKFEDVDKSSVLTCYNQPKLLCTLEGTYGIGDFLEGVIAMIYTKIDSIKEKEPKTIVF